MDERPSIPVIHYDTARVPDDRPGAGEQAAERFWDVRTEVLDLCRKYGPVGPDDDDVGYEDFAFWVVADQYNYERYQYVEICQPAGMTEDWLLDLAALLRAKWPYWGVGVSNVPLGYLIAFGDRLMVTGPTFESCTTITDVVARAWEGLTLQAMIRSCRSDGDLERLLQVPGVDELPLALRKLEQVTDVGLSFVARLREIRNLDLGKSHITNQGLAGLGPLRKLETLEPLTK